MNLDVTFRNLRPRDEIRRRGDVLFGKLERFLDPAADGQMVVSIEHHEAIVEVVVTTLGHVCKAEERSDDLRTAMDKALQPLVWCRLGLTKKALNRVPMPLCNSGSPRLSVNWLKTPQCIKH